jgi:CHAD domain-containing protein
MELVRAGKKARRRGKPRDWHRLRTTSRRLRGALTAHADVLDPASRPKLDQRAKQITKLPAKVRDLDVALANLVVLRCLADRRRERRAAREMRERLERKRARSDRKLKKHLERERPVRALATSLRRALRHDGPHPAERQGGEGALGACARVVIERRARIGDWDDDEGLHALRVAVKKYRAALAALAETGGRARDHRATLEGLQRVLTVLGEHHDWSELSRRLDQRRLALAHRGARHRELVGYEALLARARQQQKARHDRYRAELHDELLLLVTAPARSLAAPASSASLPS